MEGELLGERYRLQREVGAGGMGVVYEALDQTLGTRVAVKVLSTPEDASPEAVARLMREARAAAALGHPNIVRVTDLGRAGEGAFLVMELLSGRDLDEELRRGGPLSIERAVRVHLQLLDALGAAHAAGVLHRDVKPSNVFLMQLADGGELVKLLDFGLAYLLEETASVRLTRTGMALGTPAYMSPERMFGSPLDLRADLYAVGVCLFEALTGELPFEADHPMQMRGRVLLEEAPSLRDVRPQVGEALASFVRRALEKRPPDRFASATEMASALRAAAGIGGATSAEEDLGTQPTLMALSAPDRPAQGGSDGAVARVPTGALTLDALPAAPSVASADAGAAQRDATPSALARSEVHVSEPDTPSAAPAPPPADVSADTSAAPTARPASSLRRMMVGVAWGLGVGLIVVSVVAPIVLLTRETNEPVVAPAPVPAAEPAPAAAPPDAGPTLPLGVNVPTELAPTPEPPEPDPRPAPMRHPRPIPQPAAPPPRSAPAPRPEPPPEWVDPDEPMAPPGW